MNSCRLNTQKCIFHLLSHVCCFHQCEPGNTSPGWKGGKPGCCSSLVLISLNLMRWSAGFLVAPASQFNGLDLEDVSVLADNNVGAKEEGLDWGLRRYKLTSAQAIGDVICAFAPVRFHDAGSHLGLMGIERFTQQKSTRPKTWQVQTWHLSFQISLLSMKGVGGKGFFVCVWSVDLNRKVQRQRQTWQFSIF